MNWPGKSNNSVHINAKKAQSTLAHDKGTLVIFHVINVTYSIIEV